MSGKQETHSGGVCLAVLNYWELVVWQRAMDLVELIYKKSRNFPKEEVYGLTGQIRRAAVSIPSNLAEGQGRKSTKEFINYLSMVLGSLREVETQVLIAPRLNYLKPEETKAILEIASEVGRLLNAFNIPNPSED